MQTQPYYFHVYLAENLSRLFGKLQKREVSTESEGNLYLLTPLARLISCSFHALPRRWWERVDVPEPSPDPGHVLPGAPVAGGLAAVAVPARRQLQGVAAQAQGVAQELRRSQGAQPGLRAARLRLEVLVEGGLALFDPAPIVEGRVFWRGDREVEVPGHCLTKSVGRACQNVFRSG